MADDLKPTLNPGNTIFEWFRTDVKVAVITCLIIVVIYQWYQNGQLMQARIDDRDKFRDEIVKEVRAQIKPDIKEMKDSIFSSKKNMDTTLNNVNDYVKSQKQ